MSRLGLSAEEAAALFGRWQARLAPKQREALGAAYPKLVESGPDPGWRVVVHLRPGADPGPLPDAEGLPVAHGAPFLLRPEPRPKRLPILLADDEEVVLASTADLLEAEYEIVRAGPRNAFKQAIERWSEDRRLRLALVDLQMPGSNGNAGNRWAGFELIRRLRAERPEALIASLSAHEDAASRRKAEQAGAVKFICKGWSGEQKLQSVRELAEVVAAAP